MIDHASTIPGPAPSFDALPRNDNENVDPDFGVIHVLEGDLEPEETRPISEPPPLPTADLLPIGTMAVIPRGGARAAIVGAMLDTYRAIYALENIAGAILRGAERGGELALPVEGAVEVAKQALRSMGALVLQAARELDAGATVRP